MTRNWDDYRDEIRKLYIEDKKTLDEVMRVMKGRHNLHASERSYKTRLREWGYMKNNTEHFPRNRPKRKSAQPRLPAGQSRPTNSFTPPSTLPDQLVTFDISDKLERPSRSLQSLPASSNIYSHGSQTWQFVASPENGERAANNHYAALSEAFNELNLPLTGQNTLALNAEDGDGRTQLHRAVIDGSEELVKTLLFNGVAINIKDHVGNEPLHYAVLRNSVAMVELLLRFGADVDSKGQLGWSPLHLSIQSKPILAVLLKVQAIASCQDEKGDTPLHLYLSSADPNRYIDTNTIKLLIDAGADINMANAAGITPFHVVLDQLDDRASTYGRLRMFLESEADVFLRTRGDRLPFEVFLGKYFESWLREDHLWTPKEPNECFELFLSKGADPDTILQSGEGLTQWFLQKYFGRYNKDLSLAEVLCKNVDPFRTGENGNCLLHKLTANVRRRYGNYFPIAKLVRIVLNRDGDPNQRNLSGQTPLMTLLSRSGSSPMEVFEVLELLLARGANPFQRDHSGNIPIYETIRQFPKQAWRWGKMLLHSDRPCEEDVRENGNDENSTDNRWWQTWVLVNKGTGWEEAKDQLRNAQDSLPDDVRKQVYNMALCVLAERYLKSAKDVFTRDSSKLEEHRKYVAAILRDYRQMDKESDPAWIDYLLDLFK